MSDTLASTTAPISQLRQERDDLQQNLAAVASVFGKYSDVIQEDSLVRSLREIADGVAEDTEEMLNSNRLLRLGVVGQVKAGKSSLLNLLLFDGKEVLPKAATPMTASLTHIVKSDRDEIVIQYYSAKDWGEIKAHDQEFQRAKKDGDDKVPAFVVASHELLEMANKRNLQVEDHLGKKKILRVPTPKLNKELRRLVGSAGELTPLVKNVTIRSSQGIPDLDIVDTPGINDPIQSRSQQAYTMLKRCDAVLLLSYAGQFMDNEDVEFFVRRLPQEGIRHRLVIGSKFDNALIGVSKDHSRDFVMAKEDTEKRLRGHAQEIMHRLDEGAVKADDNPPSPIVFVSALCAILADKPASRWTPEERAAFDSLQRVYPDWLDQPEGGQTINKETKKNLAWLGNREEIDKHIRGVREDKDSIIAQKMHSFLHEKRSHAQEELDELIKDVEEKVASVRDGDIGEIEAQQKVIGNLREEIGFKVTDAWEEMIDESAQTFDQFREEIQSQCQEAKMEIKGATKTKRVRRKKEGLLPLFGRLLGLGGYESSLEEIVDRQALESTVEDFRDWLEREISQKADAIFSRSFKKEAIIRLCRIVADEISNDLASKMDLIAVERSLREAVAQTVEQADQGMKNYDLVLKKGQEKEVQDKTGFMAQAHLTLFGLDSRGVSSAREAVRKISDAGIEWLDHCKGQVDRVAAQAKTALVPAAVQQLQEYHDRIKKNIKDREFTLQRCGLALKDLKKCRQSL